MLLIQNIRGEGRRKLFLPLCSRLWSRGKKQNRILPIKLLLNASNPIKGHNSVDLMPGASKMFLSKKSAVVFWNNKQSNTFKGWTKFSSIYLGQWNIHHTETQTPYRMKDQKSYTNRRSKSQCLWGNQTSNCPHRSPVLPLRNLAYVTGGENHKAEPALPQNMVKK